MTNELSPSGDIPSARNRKMFSPSLIHRKSTSARDLRRDSRACKPHPCMASVSVARTNDQKVAVEAGSRFLESSLPNHFNSTELSNSVTTSKNSDFACCKKRSSDVSVTSPELVSSPSSNRSTSFELRAKKVEAPQSRGMCTRSIQTSGTEQLGNFSSVRSYSTSSERLEPEQLGRKSRHLNDSDSCAMESLFSEQDQAKPFLQLCFDVQNHDCIITQESKPEVSAGRNMQRAQSSRTMSFSSVSPSGRLNGRVAKASPEIAKNDRRHMLQKSNSISLRAVTCTSIEETTFIITSDHHRSHLTTPTVDETPSPSTSSNPFEASLSDDDSLGNDDDQGLVHTQRVSGVGGLIKSIHSSRTTRSTHTTSRLSAHKRSSQRRLNLKGTGDAINLLSQRLFATLDAETCGSRRKTWGYASERRERSLSVALSGLGVTSSHERPGSRRFDLKRVESVASLASYGSSVITTSTMDRRKLLERSKSTTSIASFSITPSVKNQNSEHLRSVNAMILDSAKPLSQDSRMSLHALLTDAMNHVTKKEASAVMEKYQGVSGDELVELMSNFSCRLNETMRV